MYALVFVFMLPTEPVVFVEELYHTEAECHASAEGRVYQFPTIHMCLPESIFGEGA